MVVILYSIALCAAHVRPLPEQQWVRGALLLLLLFQDPGLFLRFLMGGSNGKQDRPAAAAAAAAANNWNCGGAQRARTVSSLPSRHPAG
jgi:hypothetical protein